MRKWGKRNDNSIYYHAPRSEMMPFVPEEARCILEIGCAEGTFGAAIKRRADAEVWGIEFNPEVAERATASIDRVLVGDVDEQSAAVPDAYFDVIICNDVLEHLRNPGDTLAKLRHKLKPGGVVVASIPNIRYFPALGEIIVKRDFPLEESGIFDRTHLRCFTRKSIIRMFTDSGFTMNRSKA